MWWRDGTTSKEAHEVRVAQALLAALHGGGQAESRTPCHPDIHLYFPDREVDLEITDAVAEAEIRRMEAHATFNVQCNAAIQRLPPAERRHFKRKFHGLSVTSTFLAMPPKNDRRAELALLRWLGECDITQDVWDWDARGRWREPSAERPWLPPLRGLERIHISHIALREGRTFGGSRHMLWDPGDVLRRALLNKTSKPVTDRYEPCAPVHLAVDVPFLPSEWELGQLREVPGERLREVGFRNVWFVETRHEVATPLWPEPLE